MERIYRTNIITVNKLIKGINHGHKYHKFKVGDALLVRYENSMAHWKVRSFSGVCIKISRKGYSLRYTLRNVIKNEAIEFSFYGYNPGIVSLETLGIQKFKKIRKSKLYYLRLQPNIRSRVKTS